VAVDAKGFAPGSTKDVVLNLGDQRDLGFKLGLAGSSESVEVTTTAPLIESTKTDVSTNITNLDMERLPTLAGATGTVNDYAQLALTAPGVKSDTSGLTTDLIAPGSMNNRGNLYNVDGANITDQLVSGRDGTGASIDEVQEFQVLTNNYNAEYGQATGLVLNVVTKSGTNGIHGDGHMYFRGRNLAASDPFYNVGILGDPRCPDPTSVEGCPRAPFHRKEGGFTLGGPFKKDKLFWFTSYELSRQGVPLTLTPPPELGGNVTVQSPVNNLLYSAKIDYHLTDKHLLTARYAVDRLRQARREPTSHRMASPAARLTTPASMWAWYLRYRPASRMKPGLFFTASSPPRLTPPLLLELSTRTLVVRRLAPISAARKVVSRNGTSILTTSPGPAETTRGRPVSTSATIPGTRSSPNFTLDSTRLPDQRLPSLRPV
jgi:hypothetical protein